MTRGVSGLNVGALGGQILGVGLVFLGVNAVAPLHLVPLLLGGAMVWWWSSKTPNLAPRASDIRVAGLVSLLLMSGVVGVPIGGRPHYLSDLTPLLWSLGALAVVPAIVWGSRQSARLPIAFASLAAVGLLLTALTLEESTLVSDVVQIHVAAGQALRSGQNPYTDAVQVVSGNPHLPPGTLIEGYPYPPIVLITYGLVGGFMDPRMVNTLALAAIVAWFGRRAVVPGPMRTAGLAALMLLAFTPLLAEVWFMGWTEPLTLVLFLGATLAWKKSWLWSGVLLGLALASKQYLVLLAPLLVLYRDEEWRRRSTIATVTALASLLAGLLPNPNAFISATIGNLIDIGFRPDAQSLSGAAHELGWDFILPTGVWLAVSLVVAAILARSTTGSSQFLERSALILFVSFMLGMAFPNYWFLVACLLMMSMTMSSGKRGGTGTPLPDG